MEIYFLFIIIGLSIFGAIVGTLLKLFLGLETNEVDDCNNQSVNTGYLSEKYHKEVEDEMSGTWDYGHGYFSSIK